MTSLSGQRFSSQATSIRARRGALSGRAQWGVIRSKGSKQPECLFIDAASASASGGQSSQNRLWAELPPRIKTQKSPLSTKTEFRTQLALEAQARNTRRRFD